MVNRGSTKCGHSNLFVAVGTNSDQALNFWKKINLQFDNHQFFSESTQTLLPIIHTIVLSDQNQENSEGKSPLFAQKHLM